MNLNTIDVTKGGINLLSWKTWVGAGATAILLGVVVVGASMVSKKTESLGVIAQMQDALGGLGG